MNIKTGLKSLLAGAAALAGLAAGAAPTVTLDGVTKGASVKDLTVSYTVGGTSASKSYEVAFEVTANGVTKRFRKLETTLANGTYAQSLDTATIFGKAQVDPALAVEVVLTEIDHPCVQLWADGPYWATCNVGATKPEESGYYFWWGDTVGYKRNSSNNGWVSAKDGTTAIQFSPSDATAKQTYGKDNATLQSEGWIDASGNLTMAHDAARAHLGGTWRMPTADEIQALVDNTTTEWVDDYQGTGVKGRLVKGKGDYAEKSIFIPAAGYGYGSSLGNSGSRGDCWSSTPYAGDSSSAWSLYFNSSKFYRYNDGRYYGFSARPVRGFAE